MYDASDILSRSHNERLREVRDDSVKFAETRKTKPERSRSLDKHDPIQGTSKLGFERCPDQSSR